MPMLAYTAPSTVEEAVRVTRRSLRRREGPVRRDRSAGSAALRPGQAGTDRRYQEDPRHLRHSRARRRLRHRRRDPRRSDRRVRSTQAGLARSGRGRQPDRLDPGAGPGVARRQSLQCVAGGRQRSGADRRARDLRGRRRRTGSARFRWRASSRVRGAPRSTRGRVHHRVSPAQARRRARRTPICASFRAPRWTLRWSAPAVNVTLDRRRRLHRCAGRAGRRRADRGPGCRMPPPR